jgi:flagellar hook-basal body complex protein FliE
MANEFASLIRADLAALTNSAAELGASAIAPAMHIGGAGQPDTAPSFAQSMRDAVGKVDAAEANAGQRMADVDAGRSGDLVGAMLASQEASLSFSMLMQVRNKVMGAVDELIKLPL